MTVSVNVTDTESGVAAVILSFTTDGGATWQNQTMSLNVSTGLYETVILGQKAGTTVRFKIIVFDVAGNVAVLDGEQSFCVYIVIPELQPIHMLACFALASALAYIQAVRLLKHKNKDERLVKRAASVHLHFSSLWAIRL